MNYISLSSVREGADARVSSLNITGALRRRIMDLGFTPGAAVSCLFSAPSGDPRAYMVRGAVIALRQDDADLILMKTDNGEVQ